MHPDSTSPHALRGPALTFVGNPFEAGTEAVRHEPDAILAMQAGRITHFGPAERVLAGLPPGIPVRATGRNTLMLAGFIDAHVHYSQTQIIASCGEQLIDWLNRYTFVAEQA